MELMFVIIIAIAIGLGIRYVLPGRDLYGVALVPAVDGAVTAILWVAFVWAGWKFDGGWIWAVTLVAGALVAIAVALALPRGRRAADADMLQKLSRA